MTIHSLRLSEQLFLPRKSDNSGGNDLFFDLPLNLCQKLDLTGGDDLFFWSSLELAAENYGIPSIIPP